MTLFATEMRLDRKALKQLNIKGPYSLHREVYKLYADIRSQEEKSASVSSGILYADLGGGNGFRRVLMLANRKPALSADEYPGRFICRKVPDSFLAHDHYRFRVIINPTRRESQSRRLVPLKKREDIAAWFENNAPTSWGFKVTSSSMDVQNMNVLRFEHERQKREITIARAEIQGILSVDSPEQFRNSFTRGIGRARAFGCGLLQLVPVSIKPANQG